MNGVTELQSSNLILFYNCEILTMDKKNSTAESMAIFKDKIIAIGSENDVRNKIKEFIKKYQIKSREKLEFLEKDMEGFCIVPGFIDVHMHPIYYFFYKTQLNLTNIKSYSELENVLKKEDRIRNAGDWILGMNLLEDSFDNPDERRFPDRFDLDLICSERPIVIIRHDGHICSANSAVLKIIGINATNAKELTPKNGEVRLNKEGEPTGIFTEVATALVLDHIPINFEGIKEAAKEVSKELASFGITTCGGILQAGEIGISGKAGAFEWVLMQELIKEDLIEQDYVFYMGFDKPRKLKKFKESFLKLNKEENRFIVGGIKLFADGTFGACTAYLFEPFYNSTDGNSGFMVNDEEILYGIAKETYKLDFQTICHSIGDKSCRIVVDIYKNIIDEIGNIKSDEKSSNISNRFRIEHASLLREDIIKDAAKYGLIFACQPAFINSEYTWLEGRLGPERIKWVYPFRSIIDSGIVLAGASDSPIESASILEAFRACVTRNGFVPEQAISAIETLKIFTYNAAFALGQEDIKGSLEKGKLADFVILNHNITSIPTDELTDIKIIATYHRGRLIYSSE